VLECEEKRSSKMRSLKSGNFSPIDHLLKLETSNSEHHRLIPFRVEIIHMGICQSFPSRPLLRIKMPSLYSNGLVWVPHQVRKSERPTVSKTRAKAPTATVSRGRFSVVIWAMKEGAELAMKIKEPKYAAPL